MRSISAPRSGVLLIVLLLNALNQVDATAWMRAETYDWSWLWPVVSDLFSDRSTEGDLADFSPLVIEFCKTFGPASGIKLLCHASHVTQSAIVRVHLERSLRLPLFKKGELYLLFLHACSHCLLQQNRLRQRLQMPLQPKPMRLLQPFRSEVEADAAAAAAVAAATEAGKRTTRALRRASAQKTSRPPSSLILSWHSVTASMRWNWLGIWRLLLRSASRRFFVTSPLLNSAGCGTITAIL
jgi:hypothetical protein